jgi:excisionase family DNA binding protein
LNVIIVYKKHFRSQNDYKIARPHFPTQAQNDRKSASLMDEVPLKPKNSQNGSLLQEPKFEPLLTLREAAALLEMHSKTLASMAREGDVPAFRVRGRWRFRASLLNSWLEKRLVTPRQAEVQWNKPAALRESGEEK